MTLPPLAAETITHIGGFPVTNSYINSLLTVIGFVVFAYIIKRSVARLHNKAPRGILNLFESVLELLLGYFDSVTRDRKKSIRFLPLVGTLFFFILVSNWIGLLPGIGSIGRWGMHEGHLALIPLFRPATTDLNTTLSMAVLVVASSHVLGVAAIGFFKYANKFIKLGDVYRAVRSGSPTKILVAAVEFVVGIIEIFSEVAKMASLSLRLFGNVFAGEVLLTVLASIIAYAVPLPFMALEILVGVVQATVFSLLTLVYLTIATTEVHEHDAVSHKEEPDLLEPTPTV
jgi:F-type H+-transporting ATPase subunit a